MPARKKVTGNENGDGWGSRFTRLMGMLTSTYFQTLSLSQLFPHLIQSFPESPFNCPSAVGDSWEHQHLEEVLSGQHYADEQQVLPRHEVSYTV